MDTGRKERGERIRLRVRFGFEAPFLTDPMGPLPSISMARSNGPNRISDRLGLSIKTT